jgi:hypothetical protein
VKKECSLCKDSCLFEGNSRVWMDTIDALWNQNPEVKHDWIKWMMHSYVRVLWPSCNGCQTVGRRSSVLLHVLLYKLKVIRCE